MFLTVLLALQAYAGDDRFGVATHFRQGWPVSLIPSIKALGVGWIRDEYTPPVAGDWYHVAKANGLKVCCVIGVGANGSYSWMPAFAATLAKTGLVSAIEIVNEANNVKEFQGAIGEQRLVWLTNSVDIAVHTVARNVSVIGLDEQGSEIIHMLGLYPLMDGLVYHPYPPDNVSPLLVYEPPYTVYVDWVNIVRAHTKLPLWETEWGFRGSPTGPYTYALQSSRLLQRLALTQSLKIEHTFIYEFKDNGTENYGLCDNAGHPKPAYYAVQHFIATQPKP